MKKYLMLLLLVTASGFSQSISDYRYAIIPAKFNAQKKSGQFGLNELTRQFLQKNGYTAYLDSEILPAEVTNENCNKFYIDVYENNSMLKTRLKVVIKDCTNKILFTSEEGESIDKDNRVAYNQALRAAFQSFDKPEYRYNPSSASVPKKEEPQTVKAVDKPLEKPAAQISISRNDFFAKPIAEGYQLLTNDTAIPQYVLTIFKTSAKNVYLATLNNRNGVVVNKSGQWLFECYENGKLVSENLQIVNLKVE